MLGVAAAALVLVVTVALVEPSSVALTADPSYMPLSFAITSEDHSRCRAPAACILATSRA